MDIPELIHKFLEGDCSEEEIRLLNSYFGTDSKKDLERLIKEDWNNEQLGANIIFNEAAVWERIEDEVNKDTTNASQKVKIHIPKFFALAATVLLLITLSIYFISGDTTQLVVVENLGQEPKQIKLEDGTRVWLNKNTKLFYNDHFSADLRIVNLEGEAYFEVAHDKSRPFVVKHGGLETKVLGTHFNIKEIEGRPVEVSLFSGKVKVVDSKDTWMLQPGKLLRYQASTKSADISSFDVSNTNILGWKSQKLVFNNQSLISVLKSVETKFNTSIDYNKTDVEGKYITAEVPYNESLQNVLEIILYPHQLTFEISKNHETITIKNNRKGY